MRNRLMACVVATLTIGVALNACSKEGECPCGGPEIQCSEFQPGTDMSDTDFGGDPSIKGQLEAYAQATGNLSVVAGDALVNVTSACRNIAIDLGAGLGGEIGRTGTDLLDYWCDAARQQLGTVVAAGSGSVTLSITPAKCSASIIAATKCQSHCASDGGTCASTLATCAGGTIESACTQGCAAGSAPYDCEGSCTGQCTGACTPASDGGACEGFCDGQCNGTCDPLPGQTSAICSGNCLGSSQPIACVSGALSGGCATDTDCQSNCNASAQAAALCATATVVVSTSSEIPNDIALAALASTVEKNFPALLLVIQGEGSAMASIMKSSTTGSMSLTSSNQLDVRSTVCVAEMVAASTTASTDFAAVLDAANKVSAVIGGPTAN